MIRLIKVTVANKPKNLNILDSLLEKITLECHKDTFSLLNSGRLIVNISAMIDSLFKNNYIYLCNSSGKLDINLGGEDNTIVFEADTYGIYNLVLWGNSKVKVGEKTSSNGLTVIADNSSVQIGKDCMFSSAITLQSSDQHGIIDLTEKKIINNYHRSLVIEDHVWLGRNSFVLPDAYIEEGVVVGACSTVVGTRISKFSVIAGSPAKIVRENATWSRSMHSFDSYSRSLLELPSELPSELPKKKILLFANCHGEIYKKAIEQADISNSLDIVHILSYENLENFEKIRKHFEACDVLIIQPVKSYETFKIENLKKLLKSSCQIIQVPFVRFDGLWEKTDVRSLSKFDSSAVMFFPNLHTSSQIATYLSGSHLSKGKIQNNFEKSVMELKQLEQEGDIKFFDFIMENFRKVPLFRDSYHPTRPLYDFLASQIVQKIGQFNIKLVDSYEMASLFEPLQQEFGHFKPINDHVANVLGIQYSLDTYWKYTREQYLTAVLDYENSNELSKIENLHQFKKLLEQVSK